MLKSKSRIIVLAIFLVLIIVVVIWIFSRLSVKNLYSDEPTNKEGNTTGNIFNGGEVACQGDTVFFVNQNTSWIYFMPFSKSNRIFGMKITNLDAEKILGAQVSGRMSVVGEHIYYDLLHEYKFASFNPSGQLYCYNLRTQKTEFIGPISDEYFIENNCIYYLDNSGKIMTADLDGKNAKQFAKDQNISNFYYDSGYFYYFDTEKRSKDNVAIGAWYRVDINGNNKEFVLKDPGHDYYKEFFCNNVFYHSKGSIEEYGSSNPMYEYNLSTKTDKMIYTPLKNDYVKNMNISGGWMYYTDKNDWLYKMKLDGSCNKLLYKAQVGSIYIANNKIYFYEANEYPNLYRINQDGTNLEKIKP
ncbi:MAG: DUF5050 domain-containing protein [Bacillota bacterium]|nr:DUF5050 domain-containing protein [Bacillota bacterium]